MSFTIEKLPGEPILLATGNADFHSAEGPALNDGMYEALEALSENVYLISDMARISFTLDDVLEGSTVMTSRGQKPVWAHARVIENIFVTSSGFIKMAAKGLSAPIFGGLQIKVCETRDEALAHCRGKIAGS
jgi:hypothetical protein